MAQWARGGRSARYYNRVYSFASLHVEGEQLVSGLYRGSCSIATEVDQAVQGFLDGIRLINVPNDSAFCAAVRQQYAAALAARAAAQQPAEVQP